MNKLTGFIVNILVLSSLIACDGNKDKELILGHWTGVEWLENGVPSVYTPGDASFDFDNSGNYTFTYGENAEKGKYFISNHQLFTTPEGGIKMMVKVTKLTTDTLSFDMNRGGEAEKLKLVKK